MSQYVPVMSGPWSEDATWGTIQGHPGETDSVLINQGHTITIDTNIKVKRITLDDGGLLVADDTTPTIEVTDGFVLVRHLGPMPFRLDGATIKAPACLGAKRSWVADAFPLTYMITATDGAGIIIDDTGVFNASATLQDIKPEGCSRAYARKIGNAVRYLTMTVRIQRGHADEQKHLRDIYLWAEMPFQVIGINGSCAIKGYVESVVYDKACIGTAYHVLQVTIAEGQQ